MVPAGRVVGGVLLLVVGWVCGAAVLNQTAIRGLVSPASAGVSMSSKPPAFRLVIAKRIDRQPMSRRAFSGGGDLPVACRSSPAGRRLCRPGDFHLMDVFGAGHDEPGLAIGGRLFIQRGVERNVDHIGLIVAAQQHGDAYCPATCRRRAASSFCLWRSAQW